MVNKINSKDVERRRILAESFIQSEFYRNYLEPEIKEQIERNNKLSKIDDNMDDSKILIEFKKRKYKVSIYQGLLSKIEEWSKKSYKGGK